MPTISSGIAPPEASASNASATMISTRVNPSSRLARLRSALSKRDTAGQPFHAHGVGLAAADHLEAALQGGAPGVEVRALAGHRTGGGLAGHRRRRRGEGHRSEADRRVEDR